MNVNNNFIIFTISETLIIMLIAFVLLRKSINSIVIFSFHVFIFLSSFSPLSPFSPLSASYSFPSSLSPSLFPPLSPSLLPSLPLSVSPFIYSPVETPSLRQFRVDRFLLLGALVVTVCILSFGPFIAMVRNIILAYQLGVASLVSEIKLAYGP